MPSGWTRWLLEQFEFPFEVVFPAGARCGQPRQPLRRDHLSVRRRAGAGRWRAWRPRRRRRWWRRTRRRRRGAEHPGRSIRASSGRTPRRRPVRSSKKFLEDGGTILAVGRSAMNLAELIGLPVDNHLVERSPGRHRRGRCRQRSTTCRARCSASRSTTRRRSRTASPTRSTCSSTTVPVFRLEPEAALKGVRPVAWFDSANPLRSGWAYGQGYLQGGVAVVDASVGKGKLFLFGPEITFRAQPHGTFKFLFNGIYLAARAPGAGRRPTARADGGQVPLGSDRNYKAGSRWCRGPAFLPSGCVRLARGQRRLRAVFFLAALLFGRQPSMTWPWLWSS